MDPMNVINPIQYANHILQNAEEKYYGIRWPK